MSRYDNLVCVEFSKIKLVSQRRRDDDLALGKSKDGSFHLNICSYIHIEKACKQYLSINECVKYVCVWASAEVRYTSSTFCESMDTNHQVTMCVIHVVLGVFVCVFNFIDRFLTGSWTDDIQCSVWLET